MAGYTKQDTSGKIANGNIVDADDFNDEFNTLQTAFGVSGGHDHSSTTAGNGAPITKAGADYRYEFTNDALIPKTSFTSIDIGSSTRTFDTAHFSGKVNSATLETTGAATLNSLVVGSSTAVTAIDTDLASVAGTDTTLASAKSIKAYVDAQVTASDLDLSDGSATIAIDLDSETLIVAGGTGITTSAAGSTITISSDDANINHDTLNNFVGNEHIDHTSVSVTAGNGLTGGGTIAATRTLTVDPHTGIAVTADGVALSHLGLQDLVDPNADRVAFWDDTAAKFDWLTMGTNLAISGTTLNATVDPHTGIAVTADGVALSHLGLQDLTDPNADRVAFWNDSASKFDWLALGTNLAVSSSPTDTTLNATDTNTTYTAGTGLTLDGTTFNVSITDTNTTYTAGTGLTLTGTVFSADATPTINTINSTGFTLDSSGDITFDADGNDFIFKNGAGGDTATLSYADNGLLQLSNAQTLQLTTTASGADVKVTTLNRAGGLRLHSTASSTYNLILGYGDASNNAFINAAAGLTIDANGGPLVLETAGNDTANDITLNSGGGDIKFNHTDVYGSHSYNFDLSGGNISLSGLHNFTVTCTSQIHFNPSGNKVNFQRAGATKGYIKVNTGDIAIYAGGSLNSTFTGANLAVAGALSKGSGSFKIDHPLPAKADTHHLVHSFIEGPQADLIYRGRVALVGSTVTVDIDIAAGMTDGTFVALCEDVQCFTSNESGWSAVKGSVSGNTLTIVAQDADCTDTISWMVVGERKDPHMLDAATDWTDSQGKVIVEPAKPAE